MTSESVQPQDTVQAREISTCFIESHPRFRWHPGMMLEGSRMQIS